MSKARSAPDHVIIIVIFLLLAIGVLMVYSASAAFAFHKYQDSFYLQSGSFCLQPWGYCVCFSFQGALYDWEKMARPFFSDLCWLINSRVNSRRWDFT